MVRRVRGGDIGRRILAGFCRTFSSIFLILSPASTILALTPPKRVFALGMHPSLFETTETGYSTGSF